MNKNIIFVVLLTAFTAGGFFGGMKYQQSKRSNLSRQFMNQQGNGQATQRGQGMPQGNRTNFRPVNGEIISADDKSITVKMTDGSSKIVLLSNSTVINKAETATVADLKVGEKVMVVGQSNTDGSVTAQNISLNPIVREFNQPSGTPSIPVQ